MNAFEQLRDTETGEPIAPNAAFAARLRARVTEALGAIDPDVPTVQLPDRTHTVSRTANTFNKRTALVRRGRANTGLLVAYAPGVRL